MRKNKKIYITKWKILVSLVLLCCLAVALVFADKLEVLVGYKTTLDSHQSVLEKIENSNYYVSYIDVGQGASSYIQLPDGKNVLIDGGDVEYGETVGDFLEKRNVKTIDYMIATHADSDHIGGLNYILENFEIKNIFRPFQISLSTSDTNSAVYEYEDLAEAYNELQTEFSGKSKVCKITSGVYRNFIKNIYTETYTENESVIESSVTVFYDGLKVSGENYEIEFFAPLKRNNEMDFSAYSHKTKGYATDGFGASSTTSNDNSAIFTVTCFDDMYLFMGDSRYTESGSDKTGFSEMAFINSLTNEEKTRLADVDVLLLGHHGSKYSTSSELLNIVLPRFVIVSAGAKNTYGHPAPETLERVSKISSLEDDYLLRTDKNGDIEFSSIDGVLVYSLESENAQTKLKLPFKVLCVIITFAIIFVILSIKVKIPKKARR